MNKLIHNPNVAGQSLADHALAAVYSVKPNSTVAKVVCKATTDEVIAPKRKHIDCKYDCIQNFRYT